MPRRDYVEIAHALGDADVIDADYMRHRASPTGRMVARRVGLFQGVLYEATVHARRYRYLVSCADRVGIPLAMLYKALGGRRDLHLLAIYLSQGRKAMLLRDARVHTHLQSIICQSSMQMELAASRLNVPADRIHYVRAPVDDRFWAPIDGPVTGRLLSVGWEARDYQTLMAAVRDLPVQVDIAVGTLGLWASDAEADNAVGAGVSRRAEDQQRLAALGGFRNTLSYPWYRDWIDDLRQGGGPPNVSVQHQLSPSALRDRYARSSFVVLPLHDVEFDAGTTTITEALAMGKPVITTRTRGQVDVIEEGVTGLYVPPGDPRALRAAIEHLTCHPTEAARMGRAGRELVLRTHSLDSYVSRVAGIVRSGRVDA